LIIALIASTALAEDGARKNDPLVKQWWERFLSIPNVVSAELKETPAACGLGQRGDIWFLSVAAGPGDPITREGTIPRGRKVFVALVTAVCPPFPGETLEENIQICREAIDPFDKLTLRIDGQNRDDLIERRAHSRGFSAWFPEDNVFDTPGELDVPEGVYITVADGQFALIEGLAVGEHVIRARATSTIDANAPKFDVTFKIRISAPSVVTPR
jgi:hypothetical protein